MFSLKGFLNFTLKVLKVLTDNLTWFFFLLLFLKHKMLHLNFHRCFSPFLKGALQTTFFQTLWTWQMVTTVTVSTQMDMNFPWMLVIFKIIYLAKHTFHRGVFRNHNLTILIHKICFYLKITNIFLILYILILMLFTSLILWSLKEAKELLLQSPVHPALPGYPWWIWNHQLAWLVLVNVLACISC